MSMMPMPHRADVYRRKWTKTAHAGQKELLTRVFVDVECWVQLAGAAEIRRAQKRDQIITHQVYLTENVALQPGDELWITGGGFDGEKLEYKAMADATAGLGYVYKANTEQIRRR